MASFNLNKKSIINAILICILLFGFLVRFYVYLNKGNSYYLVGDAKNYYIMSHQIVDDGIYGYRMGKKSGLPNAYVTPGYPLFLSTVYMLTRDNKLQIDIVRLLQIVVGGLFSPLLSFLIVRRLLSRNDKALLTAFFVASYPTYVLSAMQLLTEVFSLFFMLLYFYVLILSFKERKAYLSLIAGAVFAINILIRPVMFPLLTIPFLIAFLADVKNRKTILPKLFLLNLIGFVILMLPWWLRNYIVLNRFILLATGSENPFLAGTYPYMKDLFKDYLSEKNRVSQGAYAKKRILEGFSSQPLLYLKWYTAGKLQFLFEKPWLYMNPPYNREVDFLIQKPMLPFHNIAVYLGAIGVVINSYANKIHRYVNIYALLMLFLYLPFIPVSRYVYQIMFFLFFAASELICNIISHLRKNINKGM